MHMNDSGIQAHSAGELFPTFIVGYGDGSARWVNPEKQVAGPKVASYEYAEKLAKYAKEQGYYQDVSPNGGYLYPYPLAYRASRRYYQDYARGD